MDTVATYCFKLPKLAPTTNFTRFDSAQLHALLFQHLHARFLVFVAAAIDHDELEALVRCRLHLRRVFCEHHYTKARVPFPKPTNMSASPAPPPPPPPLPLLLPS